MTEDHEMYLHLQNDPLPEKEIALPDTFGVVTDQQWCYLAGLRDGYHKGYERGLSARRSPILGLFALVGIIWLVYWIVRAL